MMKKGTVALLAAALMSLMAASAGSAQKSDTAIAGAGSSLVAPLVDAWIPALGTAFGDDVTYAAVGSGTGIADISARTVDFGASDAPMTATQASGCNGCIEIPWALSATTLSYNLPGIKQQIRLDSNTIVGIYLGTITNWDDPAIAALNPKITFPNLAITPVHRSDGSGDTYAFTNYLSDVSPTFAAQVGNATTVTWPGGVGASGNSGIAATIASTPGAIGYISAAYLIPNHLICAAVENAAGGFATPGLKDIQADAAAFPNPTSTANGVEMHIVDPPASAGKNAYPLSTYTYIIVPSNSSKGQQIRQMIFWALTQGDKKYGPKLIFAPSFPSKVLVAAEKAIKLIQ